ERPRDDLGRLQVDEELAELAVERIALRRVSLIEPRDDFASHRGLTGPEPDEDESVGAKERELSVLVEIVPRDAVERRDRGTEVFALLAVTRERDDRLDRCHGALLLERALPP